MQELRFVAVSEDGSYAVVAIPGRSARFTLPIDERLRAVALGQASRLAQYEIEVESPLRPKEIQARIRAGETAEEIADAAGIPVERVRWFEGPVLAERAYIATQAQSASVRRPGDSAPGPRLGDIVPTRISALGADPDDAEWDSRKRGDGSWQVSLTFQSSGRLHIAEWVFDPRRRHVMPADEPAERLCLPESELPPLTASVPGEATVTPLAPRLGAVAGGMGGVDSGYGPAGLGPGGYSSGHAGGGARVRQDRPGVDRPAADRGLERHHGERGADRPAAYERSGYDRSGYERPAHERPAAERGMPDRRGSERPAGYVSAPPEPHAEPPAYPQASRPPQPPAHTLMPGHGLVPMWEPPDWDPDAEPEALQPRRPERSQPTASAIGRPSGVTFEDLDDAHAGPLSVEDPESALAQGEPVAAPTEQPRRQAAEVAAVAEHAPAPSATTTSALEAAPAAQDTTAEPAAQATATAEAKQPEAVARPAPEAEPARAEATPRAAEPGQPAAPQQPVEQLTRPRPKNPKAKGRRSSVPSWDEIMLGSSRQHD